MRRIEQSGFQIFAGEYSLCGLGRSFWPRLPNCRPENFSLMPVLHKGDPLQIVNIVSGLNFLS